jgi:hypothetical protein
MAHPVTRSAPVLLVSLSAMLASVLVLAGIRAHAETSAPPDCLAKPSGPAAKGSHWYYHIERPSGRHCWYQRPVDAAADAPAQPQMSPATVPAQPAAALTAAVTSAAAPADDAGTNVVRPVAAPPLPPWPAAARPPVAAPAEIPASAPKLEDPRPDPVVPPPAHIPARTLKVERPAEPAEVASHVPAILGATLALAVIVIGLLATWLAPRRRRNRAAEPVRDRQPSIIALREAPGIVPVMPGRGDIERALFPGEPPTQRRETARELEDNVRGLLRRLQADLRVKPDEAPAPAPGAPNPQELEAVLAMWRGKRR